MRRAAQVAYAALWAMLLVGLVANSAHADDPQAGQTYAGFGSGRATIEMVNASTGRRVTVGLDLFQGIWDSSFPACLPDTRCPAVPTAMYLVFGERFVSSGVEQINPVLLLAGRAETGTFVTTPDGDLYVGVDPIRPGMEIGAADEYGYQSSRMGGQCTVTLGGSFEQGLAGSIQCAGLGPGPLGDFVDASGTFSTGPGVGATPTSTAPVLTASPSAFGVGIGCGVREDAGLRLLACTASPFGQAADAVLVYEWRVDGITRPEAGSTMQVDIVRENLPAGSHAIGVTVTDTRNNVQATNSASVDTTTAAFAVSLACTYSESQGTYELACSAVAANPPPNADLSYAWTVNGAPVVNTSETLSRSVDQGPVQVTVMARDGASGQQTNTASFFLTINPVGTLTNLLTLGQTSDPQNVIDALAGSAAVALVVGAGAAIGGALAGAGGVVGGGSVPVRGSSAPGGGSAPATVPGSVPLNAQPMGNESPGSGVPGLLTAPEAGDLKLVEELLAPTEGVSPSSSPSPSTGTTEPTTGSQPSKPPTTSTTSAGPTSEQVAEGAAEFLAAEAGKVPPPTPENLEQWRNLSGFPNTPEGNAALQRRLNELRQLQEKGKNPDTDLFLRMLREQAVELIPPSASPTPSAPNPDKAYEDAANLLDRTEYEWQYDIDRTKLPFETGPIEPKEPPSGKPPGSGKPPEKK